MKFKNLLKTTALTALLLIGAKVGWGQALLEEDFNYSVGTSLISNGWVEQGTATTTNVVKVADGNLSYTGYYSSSNIGKYVALANSGQDVYKTFTSQNSGSVYISFLVNISAANTAGDYFFALEPVAANTSYFARLFVKKDASNKLAFGICKASTPNYTGFNYDLNTTYLLVVKYTVVSGTTNDNIDLIINPTVGSAEPAATVSYSDLTATDATAVVAILLRQGSASNAATLTIDGIRVATTWADATPDTNPPVATFNPADGSITANPDGNIVITFNKAIFNSADGSVISNPSSLITLKENVSNNPVGFTAVINDNKQITITPTSNLSFNLAYNVSVSAAIEDAYGHEATAPQSAIFTTRIQDVTAPTWTTDYPKVSDINNSDFNLKVSIDEIGKAYYVVLADGATAPSVTQVIAGQDGTGVAALKAGNINITTASTEFTANISGLTAGTIYDVYVVAQDVEITPNVQATVTAIANVATTGSKPEPTSQATGLGVVINSQTALTLNWTDATGTQLPDGYLILANTTGTFTDPADGTAQADDLDLSDGSAVANIAQGIQTKAFTGLVAGTKYYFAIYSYTNSGTAIDYLLTTPPTANASTPKLALTYPNGGETFYAGDNVTFLWNTANMDAENVMLEAYVYHMGTSSWGWTTIIASTANDGSEAYTIPADAAYGVNYKIRITGVTNGITDESDAPFTIKAVTNNLVDLQSMPTNAIVKYTGKATVTFTRTSRNQKYIQDASGAVLIDDATTAPGYITGTYNIGDGITNVEGKISLYFGLIEFTPQATTGATCTGNPVITPEVKTMSTLTTADQSKLVKINSITFTNPATEGDASGNFASGKNYTINDGTSRDTVYQFRTGISEADYIGTPIPTTAKSSIVLVNMYKKNASSKVVMQIMARNLADFLITGINDNLNTSLTVYPNPFTNKIIFNGTDNVKRVIVTSITGQVLKNVAVGSDSSIDTQDLPQGMYIVTFTNDKGAKSTVKMIKQ